MDCDGQTWVNDDFAKLQSNFKSFADIFKMQGKYVEVLMCATGWGTKQIKPSVYIEETVKHFL
jgi:hypothetical protein